MRYGSRPYSEWRGRILSSQPRWPSPESNGDGAVFPRPSYLRWWIPSRSNRFILTSSSQGCTHGPSRSGTQWCLPDSRIPALHGAQSTPVRRAAHARDDVRVLGDAAVDCATLTSDARHSISVTSGRNPVGTAMSGYEGCDDRRLPSCPLPASRWWANTHLDVRVFLHSGFSVA